MENKVSTQLTSCQYCRCWSWQIVGSAIWPLPFFKVAKYAVTLEMMNQLVITDQIVSKINHIFY